MRRRRRRRLLRASLGAAARIVCFGESQRDGARRADGNSGEARRDAAAADRRHVLLAAPAPPASGRGRSTVGKDLARDYATVARAVEPLDVDVDFVAMPRNLEGVELPANVDVRSGILSTELRDLYARAASSSSPQRRDEFAYGSEGGGLTALLEAMAMARPVVATERAIIRDYVDDGVEASSYRPRIPAALRAAIERCSATPSSRARLGARRAPRRAGPHPRGFAAQLAPRPRAWSRLGRR